MATAPAPHQAAPDPTAAHQAAAERAAPHQAAPHQAAADRAARDQVAPHQAAPHQAAAERAAPHQAAPDRAAAREAPDRGAPDRAALDQAAPRRSRLATAAAVTLSAVVLLGGAIAGLAFLGDDTALSWVLRLGSGAPDGRVATAPLNGRKTATFDLVAATTKVTVRSTDLGDDLYRITSAGDSGTVPSVVLTGNRVRLLLARNGDGSTGDGSTGDGDGSTGDGSTGDGDDGTGTGSTGDGVVEVLLSSKVTWALRFAGGADEQIIDLTGGRISSLDLTGGTRRVELTLPRPTGTVPVRVTGAVADLSVASPAGSPVRVRVGSGARTVTAGERQLRDLAPGSTLTPKDWKSPNRYDVDAASRITSLSVKTAS
ncbi:MAG TPA: hypothetical protein VFR35_20525 [Actinoplanes sp.]|nr:hypothetical protein [Actinoplanes sp.]